MENERLITIHNFCTHYNVEVSFVQSLNAFGLVEIITVDETECLDKDKLSDLEKIIRLHYDLDINLAGIDAISHLLQRVNGLQQELNMLKNRLNNHQY